MQAGMPSPRDTPSKNTIKPNTIIEVEAPIASIAIDEITPNPIQPNKKFFLLLFFVKALPKSAANMIPKKWMLQTSITSVSFRMPAEEYCARVFCRNIITAEYQISGLTTITMFLKAFKLSTRKSFDDNMLAIWQ
jgi:hypothetical protein